MAKDVCEGKAGESFSPPDYEGEISRKWKENSDDVGRLLGDSERVEKFLENISNGGDGGDGELGNLMKKVSTFASNFGYRMLDVIEEILKNKYFRSTFAVDPRRQSIDEGIAYDWLKKFTWIENLEKLPGQGSNALYVGKDGSLRRGRKYTRRETKPSKSLDFRWEVGGAEFFAMHKRTVGEGGSQDSTGREMRRVVDNFREDERGEVLLVLILDGDYWDGERREALQEYVKQKVPNCLVGPIEEVPGLLEKYRKDCRD